MTTIGVDGKPLQGNMTGVGKYLLSLLTDIDNSLSNIHFLIYTNRKIETTILLKSFEIIEANSVFAKLKPMIWYMLFSFKTINKTELDFFIASASFVPLFLKEVTIINIVHDLNYILVPETMSKLNFFTYWLFFRRSLGKANKTIAVSNGTKNKLIRYYKKNTDFVIYPKISDSFHVLPKNEVAQVLDKIGINYPYILSVGTLEPRKNVDKIIDAFLSLKSANKLTDYKLILVGSKGWRNAHLQKKIEANKEAIVQLGYLNDQDLPALYNATSLFIFPSLYEGFGIPPAEAMYCGAVCVVSDIEELREATMNKAIYIDPENKNSLKQTILKYISQDNFYRICLEEKNSKPKKQIAELIDFLQSSKFHNRKSLTF